MTTRARARNFLVIALLLCPWPSAEAQTLDRPPIRVQLVPDAKDDMSGITWNAMTEECQRIWVREGVEITWGAAPGGGAPFNVSLPIVFDDRQLRKHDSGDKEAFGVTLFSGRSQTILVSIKRARGVVAARRGLADSNDALSLDIVHGRLLGRVVAHEVGHALLLTLRHAAEGLMSPQLEQREVPPLGDAQFALVASDRERLATRFSNTGSGERLAVRTSPPPPSTAASGEAAVVPITWRDVPPRPSLRRAPR
jgi:hypothetical protein